MAMTMAEFLALAQPDLDRIAHEAEQKLEPQYTQIFNVGTLNDLYKIDAKMAGFGSPVEIQEGQDVTYDKAIPPIQRRYDLQKFGLGYKITDKLWKFDRYGEVKKFEADLRAADDDHTETYAFGLLNNGTNTTVAAGFDGLPLFSTSHTRLDGGPVIANRPTTLTALSLASLQDAIIAFKKFKNDRGRPYRSIPRRLVIPVDLEMVAEEILGSEKVPTSANNAVNAVRMYNISPLSTLYITSTTFAALLGDKHDLNILWNQKPQIDSMTDFDSDTILRKLTKWLARGFGEWRGTYLLNT